MHAIDIDIGRFHVRYRLPAGGDRIRRRLDATVGLLLHDALERAVEGADILPQEEICIRRVSRAVRLHLSATDQAMAEAWAQGLGEAVREAVSCLTTAGRHENQSAEVVRYPSRLQAIIDLAAGVAREDLRRAWAWRQLGLWPAREPASAAETLGLLTRALVREPVVIVPVFRVLAELGLLERLARRIEPNQWTAVAQAALQRCELTLEDWKRSVGEDVRDSDKAPQAADRAQRLVRSSRLARALRVVPTPSSTRRAVAGLVVMEVEPSLAAAPRDRLLAFLDAVEALLPAEGPQPLDEPGAAANDLLSLPNLRRCAFTDHGGLLFLLSVLDRLDLPARISEAFPYRPLRWVLHALGMALTPTTAGDPAVLAFAGLPPGATPPDRDEPPPSPAERDALTALVRETLAELQRLLTQLELEQERLMEFVGARRAEIIAEPGWIEAHFSLDDVSTDLRRAALDLDPGHVPWLGVVVKFVYE